MLSFSYVEDLFVEFYNRVASADDSISEQDLSAMNSFYNQIHMGNQLTQNQGHFLIKLLIRHQLSAQHQELNYGTLTQTPVWRNGFRKLDLSKAVHVEQNDDGHISVCMKFPYSLKDLFDKEFDTKTLDYNASQWDYERKLRILDVYQFNVIHLNEFVRKHDFYVDESFLALVEQVEEIWNQHEQIVPRAELINDQLTLINAPQDTLDFYQQHVTIALEHNLFLVKSMGYPVTFDRPIRSQLEQICQSADTHFWLKTNSDFFSLHKLIDGISCVILDRNTQNIIEWLYQFVESADQAGLARSQIKVCFRDPTEKKSRLNDWIKEQNLGGAVNEGRIFLFLHKPPKWLFKDDIDVKLLITNSYTPITEPTTAAWAAVHPCVCYLGDIAPTTVRNQKIVSL